MFFANSLAFIKLFIPEGSIINVKTPTNIFVQFVLFTKKKAIINYIKLKCYFSKKYIRYILKQNLKD